MREIKFRAWSKFSETMYEVREFRFNRETLLLRKDGLSSEKDFDDVELMQFTGLRDKNGKEIFEGDVLREGNRFAVVKWSDDDACFEVKVRVKGYSPCWTTGYFCKEDEFEVIGNIYETKLEDL